MPSSAAERALRRLVARLAAATPDDRDLVLEALAPAQQRQVQALLETYEPASLGNLPDPGSPAPAPAAPAADRAHLAGLSDWLAARAAAAEADAATDGARMTPAARTALAEAARHLAPEPALVLTGSSGRGRGLLDRLRGRR